MEDATSMPKGVRMGSVRIEEVYKAYGKVEVIRGVSLDIDDGEFVVLVGPSGCGKSTLLRMVAGLEDISFGSIFINDKLVNHIAPKDRDIAMVFQNYALYPHMTVAKNMAFSMRLQGRPQREIDQAVREAAEILDLTPLLERYPRQLSGGQRQRVAMGRAIVRKPQVFLFDEPLSNLDAKLRVQMRAEIKELHQRLKITTIYVTHDQIEAMTMADRIVVMNKAVVEQSGAPRDLYDFPINRFVANFLGSPSMNFINGTISRTPGGAVLTTAETMTIPLDAAPDVPDGTKVIYGIRPEHLYLVENGGIEAKVKIVEETGSETILLTAFGKEEIVVLVRERISVKHGDIVHLAAKPGMANFFDSENQTRLTARK